MRKRKIKDNAARWEMVVYITTDSGVETKYVWHGGAYVDIVVDNVAIDVINVYDYAMGKPEISTMNQLVARIKRYIKETGGDNESRRS